MNGSIACRWGRQDQPMAPMMWQCIAVLVLAGALHVSHAEIGEECFSVLDCSAEGAECHFGYSTCDKGKCQCPDGYYHHVDDNTCYQQIDFGQPCNKHEDCTDKTVGAVCEGNTCACPSALPDHTVYDGLGYCHLTVCTTNAECLANIVHPDQDRAACNTLLPPSGCVCNDQFSQDGDDIVCLALQVDEPCDGSKLCEPDTELTCDTTCKCPDDKLWSDEFGNCIFPGTTVGVGDDCTENGSETATYCEEPLTCAVCEANNANAQCQAGRGNVAIGQPCILEDPQTTQECEQGNAVCTVQYVGCDSGRCYCAEGFYLKDGFCWPDSQCVVEADCAGTLEGVVTCSSGTCVCGGDQEDIIEETIGGLNYCGRAIGTACVAQNDPSECISDIIESGSAVCAGLGADNCACADGYIAEGNVCLRLLEGAECTDNDWCRNNLECSDDQCACPADHTWDDNFQECLHINAVKDQSATQECNEEANQVENRIYCSHWLECDLCPETDAQEPTTCQTVPGQENPDEGIDLGVDCPFNGEEVATQCATENAECAVAFEDCERGVCSCMEGYYVDVNGDCSEDRTCVNGDCSLTLPGGRCNQRGNCVCDEDEGKQEYEHNGVTYCGIPDGGACLPLGDPSACISEMILQGSTQCTGLGGNSNCACEDVYQTDENTCVPYTHGDNCDGGLGRPNMVCGEGLVCQDDGDGVETCQCDGNNNEWRGAYGMCIHSDATINVEEDQPCDEANEDDAARAYCEPELVCAVCPGTDETICQVVPEVPVEDPVTTPPPQDGTTPDPDDGTDPTDPGDGAVHMHVSTVLMVLAGILACYQIY